MSGPGPVRVCRGVAERESWQAIEIYLFLDNKKPPFGGGLIWRCGLAADLVAGARNHRDRHSLVVPI